MTSKDPFVYAHRNAKKIVWMSQNTNTILEIPQVHAALKHSIRWREYSLYPFHDGLFGLDNLIMKDLGVKSKDYGCLVTNGAIEASYVFMRALLRKGDNVISTDPSFQPIHVHIRLSGAKVKDIPIYHKPWKLSPDEINDAIDKRTKLLLLIDPINPLGTSYTRDEVRAISEICKDKGVYILDDITYRDFAYRHTKTSEFYPDKTFMMYSFSKNCSMAGMRLGGLVYPKEYGQLIEKHNTNVLSANVLAMRAGHAALEYKKQWFPRVLKTARDNQLMIKKCVEKIDGVFLPVYPSNANVFVIDVSKTGLAPTDIQNDMLYNHGVFIRSGSYVSETFGDRFVRVSFTVPPAQCRKFCKAFPLSIEKLKERKVRQNRLKLKKRIKKKKRR